MKKGIIALLALSFSGFTFSQEDITEQIQSLDWKVEANSYDVTTNDARIIINENQYLVLGDDAHKYMLLVEGHDRFKPDAVAIKLEPDNSETTAVYERHDIGFIKTDDWSETINKDELLSELKEGTKEANKIRAEGHPDLFIDGWAQEPYLDKDKSVVYWAIKGHRSDNIDFINAKALKLGRKGYTEIIWVGNPEQFSDAESVLQPVLASYEYSEGFQYDDFVPETDTVAAMGAGALVYKLATGKAAAKAGLLAMLAIFAKKFWFVLFLPLIWGWKWVKGKVFNKSDS